MVAMTQMKKRWWEQTIIVCFQLYNKKVTTPHVNNYDLRWVHQLYDVRQIFDVVKSISYSRLELTPRTSFNKRQHLKRACVPRQRTAPLSVSVPTSWLHSAARWSPLSCCCWRSDHRSEWDPDIASTHTHTHSKAGGKIQPALII